MSTKQLQSLAPPDRWATPEGVQPAKVAGVGLWGVAYIAVIAYHDLVGLSLAPSGAQAYNAVWEVVKVAAFCSSPLEAAVFSAWPLLELLIVPRIWESGDLSGVPLAVQHAQMMACAAGWAAVGFAAAAQGRSSVPARLFRMSAWAMQWAMAAYLHEHMDQLCSHGPLATALVGIYILSAVAANAVYALGVIDNFDAMALSPRKRVLLLGVTVLGQLGQAAVAAEFVGLHALPALLAAVLEAAPVP